MHVAGAANLATNLCIYPLFLLSAQLQMSARKPVVEIAGKTLSQSLASFLFTHHPANTPYAAARFYGYKPALISNMLLGTSAFYRGCLTGSLHFYSSLLIQSLSSQYAEQHLSEELYKDWRWRAGTGAK